MEVTYSILYVCCINMYIYIRMVTYAYCVWYLIYVCFQSWQCFGDHTTRTSWSFMNMSFVTNVDTSTTIKKWRNMLLWVLYSVLRANVLGKCKPWNTSDQRPAHECMLALSFHHVSLQHLLIFPPFSHSFPYVFRFASPIFKHLQTF